VNTRIVHDHKPCPICGDTVYDSVECGVTLTIQQVRVLNAAAAALPETEDNPT
jgi:hypothetical protein